MIIIYKPQDGERREWHFRAEDMPSSEAEAIEDVLHPLTFDEFQVSLVKGGAKARRAILWTFLKRESPTLAFKDVVMNVGDVTVEWDSKEKARMREEAMNSTELSEDARSQVLALLEDGEVPTDPKGSDADQARQA